MIRIIIPGEPKGKARPRFCGTHTYTPKTTTDYESFVRLCYMSQAGKAYFEKTKPVEMRITAYFKPAKSTSKSMLEKMLSFLLLPLKRPDMDNIAKIIADSLNKLAYHDDSQITDLYVRKRYAERPCVVVELREAKACENELAEWLGVLQWILKT